MRLWFNEFLKTVCKKSVIGIMLALAILNGVLLYVNDKQNNDSYTYKQYKAVYSQLDGMSPSDAFSYLDNKTATLYAIQHISFGEDISQIKELYPQLDTDELMDEYNNQNYLKYTDNLFSEITLFESVKNEVKASADYRSFLDGIDESANQMTSISIFAKPDTFSYKNITKTPGDFAHLKNITLKVDPSHGVTMATDFLATDVLALLMIMTVAVNMVTREKELGQLTLARTSKNGRAKLGGIKILTCFAQSFIALILLYSTNFAIAGLTYGFGDISRQIQSVYGMTGCSFDISVAQYFVIFLAAKLVVYCLFAALIYFVTVVFDTAPKVYASLAIIIAAESVMYYTIPSTSIFGIFKYVNIVAFANTSKLLCEYLNINFFNEPINYIPVFIISCLALLAAFTVISIVVFAKKKTFKTRKSSSGRFSFYKGSTNIFCHECYKIFIGGKALPILIIFLIFTAVTYSPLSESFQSADEIYYKQYMLKFEGEYTEEKQAKIEKEEERFAKAHEDMENELAGSDGDNVLVYMNYQHCKYQSKKSPC